MDSASLRSSTRRAIGRSSRRLARVVTEYEQHKDDARRQLHRSTPDLVALARKHGTDKWGTHRYAQHYDRLPRAPARRAGPPPRDRSGRLRRPGPGRQLAADVEGVLPRGQVFGLDIHDKSALEEDRIRIFRGDQGDPDRCAAVAGQIGRLDIVVDDGSHLSEHVVTTFETLFPLLEPHGIYAVEDLQTSYWPEWHGSDDRDSPDTSMAMLKRLVDGLNHEEFVDEDYEPTYADRHVVAAHFFHNLAILEKGTNEEGTHKRSILKKRYGTGLTE